jgi:UDP-N-acetylglucosamine/UDP-N-acetylgalactosamine diphosphorylase
MDAYEIAAVVTAAGQDHLLADVGALTADQADEYLQRLAQIDWDDLATPAPARSLEGMGASRVIDRAERECRHDELHAAGSAAYADGAVAVLMVAGGMGTRLGCDGPKGCFEIGVHSGKSIYQLQAEKVLALSRSCAQAVPFLVMTSPATDEQTRAFFAVHDYFGLAADQVRFFSQGTVPSIDEAGRALLAAPGRLLENPDGHGGCFTALLASGQLARLQDEGIRHIVYIQVDNILAPVDDPMLVGVAEVEAADVVTKVLAKANPDEKVGHLVRIGDRDAIVEYTEVTSEQTRAQGDDGAVTLRWGSPAMHCWSVAFLARLAEQGYRPPLHRSRKPLQAWRDGALVEVAGYKNERFIFDLVGEAQTSIGLEIERADEFAPVKNASGVDSAVSAQALADAAYRCWLADAGVEMALAATDRVEISPLFAATAERFAAAWDGRFARVGGDLYLEEDS